MLESSDLVERHESYALPNEGGGPLVGKNPKQTLVTPMNKHFVPSY
jgi:hypothetical protein